MSRNLSGLEDRNHTKQRFGALEVDREVMDIEETIPGIKVALNTTEFLLTNRPLREIFQAFSTPTAISITCCSPYPDNDSDPTSLIDLFTGTFNAAFHKDRLYRFIHTHRNGNYNVGRHSTRHSAISTTELYVLWCGFYPMNEKQMTRKLQIKNNIPQSDKQRGLGYHHLFDYNKIKEIQRENYASGKPLQELDMVAFRLLERAAENTTSQ